MQRAAIAIALLVLAFAACKKEENPFEQLKHSSPNPPSEALPEDNFAWLHQRIFRPVCASVVGEAGHDAAGQEQAGGPKDVGQLVEVFFLDDVADETHDRT